MLGGFRRIACFLSVLLLSAGAAGTASAATAVPAAPRVVFTGPAIGLSAQGDVSAAAIRCEVGVGNDVTLYDGQLHVTWAIACRDTATNQLSPLVKDISMTIGIRKGTSIIPPISPLCTTPGPSATCSHHVLYDGFTGRTDSVMAAQVTWTDGYPPLTGSFRSGGRIIT